MTAGSNRVSPRIALIVPNFNDSRHIVRCLRSILDQEVLPDEVIVVDDCSTDNSVEVIRSAIEKHPEVTLIENAKNLGVYGALDVGSKRVSSEYIMFISANDFVFPGIFAHAKDCLARHPGVGLWSAMGWLVDDEDRPIRPLALAVPALSDRYFPPEECVRLAWRLGNWFAGPTVVYQRELLESVGRFNPAYRGLADLISALMVASKRGAIFAPVPYAIFRQHAGSYLTNTLVNPEILLPLLAGLVDRAPLAAPELFKPEFSRRTVGRFVFAAIRASGSKKMTAYQPIIGKWQGRCLALVDRLIPACCTLSRIALAFLVLRPFDAWPSIWNRYLGTAIIARRERHKVERVFV